MKTNEAQIKSFTFRSIALAIERGILATSKWNKSMKVKSQNEALVVTLGVD